MSSTHPSLHYHILFGTKDREQWIAPSWPDRLHAYIGGVVRDLDGIAEAVGGMGDHVHLLVELKPVHRIPDVVRDVKRSSSGWVHANMSLAGFTWQEGYGVFTVSASHREAVAAYILHQEEHHRKRSFKEEYPEFLQKTGISYDERFVD